MRSGERKTEGPNSLSLISREDLQGSLTSSGLRSRLSSDSRDWARASIHLPDLPSHRHRIPLAIADSVVIALAQVRRHLKLWRQREDPTNQTLEVSHLLPLACNQRASELEGQAEAFFVSSPPICVETAAQLAEQNFLTAELYHSSLSRLDRRTPATDPQSGRFHLSLTTNRKIPR